MNKLSLSSALLLCLFSAKLLALPPEVEADRLLIQAKSALDKKEYAKAADAFAQADTLGIALPEKYYLQYASALSAQEKWSEAHDVLDAYLNKFSTGGKLYKEALAQYMQAEDKAKRQPAAKHLVLNSTPAPSAAANPASTTNTGNVATASPRPTSTATKRQRPNLPLQLDEEIWRTLESSEAYRTAQDFKPLQVEAIVTTSNSKLPTLTREVRTKTIKPLGSGYAEKINSSFLTVNYDGKVTENRFGSSEYMLQGGMIPLGSVSKEGQVTTRLKRLDELRGSLFPLRIGAEMTMKFETAYIPDEKYNGIGSYTCKVTAKISANELHPDLTGSAWKIHCDGNRSSNGTTTAVNNDDYFIEDLGVMRTVIGEFDLEHKSIILPTQGFSFSLVSTGQYGSTTRHVIEKFSWSSPN